MRFRSAEAHWFETYVTRDSTVLALQALADSGVVELEADPRLAQPLAWDQVRAAVGEFRELRRRCGGLLPEQIPSPAGLVESPERVAKRAGGRLRAWRGRVDALQDRQMELETERQNLLLLEECVGVPHGDALGDLSRLASQSRFLFKGVFACPHGDRLEPDLRAAVDERVQGADHDFFIVADLPEKGMHIERAYQSRSCLSVMVPGWLSSSPDDQRRQIRARLGELGARIRALGRELEAAAQDDKVVDAIADMSLLSWFLDHVGPLSVDKKLCHITGWTTAEKPQDIQRVLDTTGVHAVIRFARPPAFSKAPVSMMLPSWARPFELFVEMLGTPDAVEINPSILLLFVIPLLFGYMFSDVGHGLLLVLFSALLYRRWPKGRFLIPCGLSAALFGLVFGEAFGVEGLLEPLWVHPLEHPLWVMALPLLFGVGLILMGMVLNGVGAHWRGELKPWLLSDAPILLMYAVATVAIFWTHALWVVGLALVWFLIAQGYSARRHRLRQIVLNTGLILQGALELILNTFSFLRVGAFALAHAALSGAIMQLVDGLSGPLHLFFLTLGHLLIIAVEGMVVFVQTTRLVLFEFFIRFLKAEGRLFRPLHVPPGHSGRE
jgi:V/A-type H+-transporting ATPase subunit I